LKACLRKNITAEDFLL